MLLIADGWDLTTWANALRRANPQRAVVVHGRDDYEKEAIRFALTWKPPAGLLAALPSLEIVFNLGAGVDALLADPTLPNVPIVRLVDDDLTWRMGEWVVLQVLLHHRRALSALAHQRERRWHKVDQPAAHAVRVGIMGYGVLGAHAADLLRRIGFQVHGWSRSPKSADITLYLGEPGLAQFLSATDILVALLPLTEASRGILDRTLIAALAKDGALGGPVLINAGRGGLQVEDDINRALREGMLFGASLDVFETEPLPEASPLWDAPNLVITPHNAAVSDPSAVARSVARRIEAYDRGEPLTGLVNRERGY